MSQLTGLSRFLSLPTAFVADRTRHFPFSHLTIDKREHTTLHALKQPASRTHRLPTLNQLVSALRSRKFPPRTPSSTDSHPSVHLSSVAADFSTSSRRLPPSILEKPISRQQPWKLDNNGAPE
ncbi:hypothetical protein VFPBJ_09887 [Purpureocillium lilacinum]|uniref:Uncharacterized protein n=1 Tax=Purpureocillium lilacinum TaxID=33203 RepID=A0A179G9V0_PURLI|nr:hypothetical protein VFPBJ_09887 [Purpureocillium lilacinum]